MQMRFRILHVTACFTVILTVTTNSLMISNGQHPFSPSPSTKFNASERGGNTLSTFQATKAGAEVEAEDIHRGSKISSRSDLDDEEKMPLVRNFRRPAGLRRIYRCANTDDLGTLFEANSDLKNGNDATKQQQFALDKKSAEYILLNRVGLILDLRSSSERNETLAQTWMAQAPGGKMSTKYFSRDGDQAKNYNAVDTSERSVYRIDVLSPKRLFDYMGEQWLTNAAQRAQFKFCKVFDTQKLHEMRMDVLNGKGLQGTYEAMLSTSGEELVAALKAITIYLENNDSGNVAVHCVKGKDRTGLIVMLCQSILNIDDSTIVKDYHLSESLLMKKGESASTKKDITATINTSTSTVGKTQIKGRINKGFFSGSPEEAMISTLAFIAEKHGSYHNYLDFIGFDISWRRRFLDVMSGGNDNDREASDDLGSPFSQSKL